MILSQLLTPPEFKLSSALAVSGGFHSSNTYCISNTLMGTTYMVPLNAHSNMQG